MGYYGILWDTTDIMGYHEIWDIMGYYGYHEILRDITDIMGYYGIWDITGYYGTSFPRLFIHSFFIIVSVLDVLYLLRCLGGCG